MNIQAFGAQLTELKTQVLSAAAECPDASVKQQQWTAVAAQMDVLLMQCAAVLQADWELDILAARERAAAPLSPVA